MANLLPLSTMLNALNAISPIDGRYRSKIEALAPYFSEWALFKFRIRIEIDYFIALSRLGLPQFRSLKDSELTQLEQIWKSFKETDASRVKEIEETTNHDVKAVEYYIKEKLSGGSLQELSEFVHFGLTSQDINNTAIPLSLKLGLEELIQPTLKKILQDLEHCADEWKDTPLLARTHGQAASPTTLGKEFGVFAKRLSIQLQSLADTPISAKFGGATGAFNAHHVAYPKINWPEFAGKLVEGMGLTYSYPTTQIDHYDQLAAVFDVLRRINTILIDFSRDVWQYISMDYFKQKINANEVGSSAMPHKVNPIDFENAEGNLGIANAIFEHLSHKLPISRLQRDLTDSTVLRNIGVPLAHQLIAFKSLEKGMRKLILNRDAIHRDLEQNWAVVAEAIQTVLRREQVEGAYELLKKFTRHHGEINKETLSEFIDQLDIIDALKEELRQITPFNYTGYAGK